MESKENNRFYILKNMLGQYSNIKGEVREVQDRIFRLKNIEEALLEQMSEMEEVIEEIPDSEMRTIFRLYYMEDMTWLQVAMRMNECFSRRNSKYTEDSCRMKHNRYLKKIRKV
ncbi:hypothetical protein [Ruminococcus gauvreauii]|uniref:hypothetical protein n=1 Tax=Ruminococcus gauvreauii TaxID=438033 RepID=UPI003984101A